VASPPNAGTNVHTEQVGDLLDGFVASVLEPLGESCLAGVEFGSAVAGGDGRRSSVLSQRPPQAPCIFVLAQPEVGAKLGQGGSRIVGAGFENRSPIGIGDVRKRKSSGLRDPRCGLSDAARVRLA
jgi:hypothetical protein